jgi:GAF domain-containing protein
MTRASDRLDLLYEISQKLATFQDLDDLLRFATRRARELFEAEGCALLLLDRERNEFFFPIASQSASSGSSAAKLAELRFPADRGVAGWVLTHDESALVEDTSKDTRFFNGVDRNTDMTTRALLCAPLRSRSGNIGVIEVVNPAPGFCTSEDLEFLEALAGDVAVAHENAALYQELRGELIGLRQVCFFAGLSLSILGLLVAAGTLLAHLAHALPMAELFGRPGIWLSGGSIAVGAAGRVAGRPARPARASE